LSVAIIFLANKGIQLAIFMQW